MAETITVRWRWNKDDASIRYSSDWEALPKALKLDCLQDALCELKEKYKYILENETY